MFHYPRSPLRYPGGKSRSVSIILAMIPTSETQLCSPFIGGGSIELACTARDMRVHGYDTFEPLIDFWDCLFEDRNTLADRVAQYLPLKRSTFYELQTRYMTLKDKLERAAVFFVLNRASFSGITLSGGMSPRHPRFTESSIDRLRRFKAKNITIQRSDFRESIRQNSDVFLYLDPPYMNGQKLYGVRGDAHEGFDHEALREMLSQRERWILSYNDCHQIRHMYSDYQIQSVAWQYGMGKDKRSKEIIICSHDLTI